MVVYTSKLLRPNRYLAVAALSALILSLAPPLAGVAAAAAEPATPGKPRDFGQPPPGVTRLDKPTRPVSSSTHQYRANLGLKRMDGGASTQVEGGSCWPYFYPSVYNWVDSYLEDSSQQGFNAGVDCEVQIDSIIGYAWIEDHSNPFNGEIFAGRSLASSSFWQLYTSSAWTDGAGQFSTRFYNGGRRIEGMLELWMEAPAGGTWEWCNFIGLFYYACDGLGTSSLHLLLGTGELYTYLSGPCRDQLAPLNDAEIERVSVPAPGTSVWASSTLVQKVPAIVNKVMAFKSALCSTSPGAAETFATTQGKQLWDTAVAEAKINTAGGDDRPLYWARLHMMAALRQWRPQVDTTNAERVLDKASRGMTSDSFSASTAQKAFISGFDPFELDSSIMNGNSSAASVLRLDGRTIGNAEVQAVIFPVRYQDFSDGLVESVITPHLLPGTQQATIINTVSQGGAGFEQEVYNGRRRSSDDAAFPDYRDNQNKLSGTNGGPGGRRLSPIVPAGPPSDISSPEFNESSLPLIRDTCTTCRTPKGLIRDISVVEQLPPLYNQSIPNDHVTPGSRAVEGSGGGFLSNELPYRVALQRDKPGSSSVMTGHIHAPSLNTNPEDAVARLGVTAQYQRILTEMLRQSQDTTPPGIGISFTPTGDAGQCGNYGQQWVPSGWTNPIRFDTDNRTGGCQLAFGISDPTLALAGLVLKYRWQVSPGGDARQCSNQGEFTMPNTPDRIFGPALGVDSDDKIGGCNLTFTMSGRGDAALDIQFWPDGDAGQCFNYRPQGQFWTVQTGSPITIGIDTDHRGGGCMFSLRLRKI